jgi:hypothetical protein
MGKAYGPTGQPSRASDVGKTEEQREWEKLEAEQRADDSGRTGQARPVGAAVVDQRVPRVGHDGKVVEQDLPQTRARKRRPRVRGVTVDRDPLTGRLSVSRAYGTREHEEPVDPATRFAAERLIADITNLEVASHRGGEEGAIDLTPRCPARLREAIHLAYVRFYGLTAAQFWIDRLLGRVATALVQQVEAEPADSPEVILDAVRADMARTVPGVEVPSWLTSEVVAWLVGHSSLGGGGGRARKLTPTRVREMLASGPAALADEIERDEKRADLDGRTRNARAVRALVMKLRQP